MDIKQIPSGEHIEYSKDKENLPQLKRKTIAKIILSFNDLKILFTDNTYISFEAIPGYDNCPELVIADKENFRDKAYTKFEFGLITKKTYDKIEKKWQEDTKKRREQEEKELLEKLKKKYEGENNAK